MMTDLLMKKMFISYFCLKHKNWGYMLEVKSMRNRLNLCFRTKTRKIIYTTVHSSYTIKIWFKGVIFTRACYPDDSQRIWANKDS